jgi:hypothetical protein
VFGRLKASRKSPFERAFDAKTLLSMKAVRLPAEKKESAKRSSKFQRRSEHWAAEMLLKAIFGFLNGKLSNYGFESFCRYS